jgi:predicted XRE-type DNA-binding protein
MSDERFSSVWDAIEDTPAEAENLKLRSALMIALKSRSSAGAGPKRKPPAGSV